jgi:hypothetical protein
MPDPTHRPFTQEQLSKRFASAGIDKATADRRLSSYPKSRQAPAQWGKHPLSGTPAQVRRHGTATDSAPAAPRSPVADALYDARRGVYYTKPVLRGWLHLIWFGASLVLGTLLLARIHGSARITVFKLIEAASERWRYVNGPHLVALVRAGAKFEKGVLIERPDEAETKVAA